MTSLYSIQILPILYCILLYCIVLLSGGPWLYRGNVGKVRTGLKCVSCHKSLSNLDFGDNFPYTIRVSNSLDTDQARHFVGPDLGLNCLQKLSADSKSTLAGSELYSNDRGYFWDFVARKHVFGVPHQAILKLVCSYTQTRNSVAKNEYVIISGQRIKMTLFRLRVCFYGGQKAAVLISL